MDTESSLGAKIDEIRDEYAVNELSCLMQLLTVDYIQDAIAKQIALGSNFLELSEEKWLYGKAHLEKEWKRPLKEYNEQSLYERLQIAMPYDNCVFYISYEARIWVSWGPSAQFQKHFSERTPFYPSIMFLFLIIFSIVSILKLCGVF